MNTDLILKSINKHIKLDSTESDFFISLFNPKHLKRKDFLLQPGEVCEAENFIVKGCLRVYSIDTDGVEHIIMFGTEGWWVCDFYSFLTKTSATYYIDALEDTEIIQISKENLDKLYERVPKFERFFRIIIQNAFISLQNRITQNLSCTAEERYLDFIKKYPKLEQRLTQKQVSAYLGITPVFLSMLRRRLSNN